MLAAFAKPLRPRHVIRFPHLVNNLGQAGLLARILSHLRYLEDPTIGDKSDVDSRLAANRYIDRATAWHPTIPLKPDAHMYRYHDRMIITTTRHHVITNEQ